MSKHTIRPQVACHCIPCRKSTGADRSLNLVIPKNAVTPTPGSFDRLVSRKGDSGGDLTYYECGNVSSHRGCNDLEVFFAIRYWILLMPKAPPSAVISCSRRPRKRRRSPF